ncbi:glycoside hydrolase family 16 protein [Cylindrobasidium torrendii FP15055 ss-10]|uniref:Glycoside hydrolase family 16 protein n=1 Tax=Cylindrobasidium torrendii FP15055 ss-10 TaxID=1314674 RepID=A0A0D7BNW4_9AGAR|nr:glycoside hydrolase family 16 protein [Cylindrobasidium torrendii FP15055 ss-10]
MRSSTLLSFVTLAAVASAEIHGKYRVGHAGHRRRHGLDAELELKLGDELKAEAEVEVGDKLKTEAEVKAGKNKAEVELEAEHSGNLTRRASEGWTLGNNWTGEDLFDAFNFDNKAADNQGAAYYSDRKSGLVWTDEDGNAVVGIDSTEAVDGLRKSIRMTSKDTFNVGSLVILDVQELPAVCGVWPAIWMNGDGVWPASGEIDILEGVNMYTQNVMSVHTNEGCYLDKSLLSALRGVTLKVKDQLSCDAIANPETCGFNVDDNSSYGPPFNSQGGGTLAVSLETSGVHFYYWKQGQVPQDIYNNTPTPSNWGDALISVISPSCKIEDHFKDMRIVVNINLAGTFTSGVWSYPGNGQEKACSEITGFNNPWDYVTQKGSAFKDAKFTIRSIKTFYQDGY